MEQIQYYKPTPAKVEPPPSQPDIVTEFLTRRGIDPDKVKDYPVIGSNRYFATGMSPAIGFVYGTEAIKWRSTTQKEFTQQGAARSFYGLNQLPKSDTLVICGADMLQGYLFGRPESHLVRSVSR